MERLRRLLTENQKFADVMWAVRGRQLAILDYPVDSRPRYGHGNPPHERLHQLISHNDPDYAQFLKRALSYREALASIPVRTSTVTSSPSWVNGWLPAMDVVANYTVLAERRPGRYIEIGSGESTKLARRTIEDNDLSTRLMSIDPHPRAEVDRLCDLVVRDQLENADLSVFADLEPGDVVFFDGSHRSFMNSDVTVFFLEVLPNLPAGVVVGLHDIELPWDYPPSWSGRYYNEQYLLAVYLMARNRPESIVFPVRHATITPELCGILEPLWSEPRLSRLDQVGGGFWFTT